MTNGKKDDELQKLTITMNHLINAKNITYYGMVHYYCATLKVLNKSTMET